MHRTDAPISIRNELILVALALVSVGLLIYETAAASLQPHQQDVLEWLDFGIALVFLVEFFYRLARAEEKLVFLKSSWWELLAAIPVTNSTTRALRGLRILRLFRVLRLIRLAVRLNVLIQHARRFDEHTHMLTITTTVASVITGGALGFHYFEFGINPAVRGFWDSMWWSIITAATVGYGDIYPHTTGGRIIAIILLVVGIGTFGAYAATLASWMTRKRE